MIFAALFIIAFLFGFASYAFTRQWVIAVAVPTVLFVMSTFYGESVAGAQLFTLTFGVPLVFFAGLLGAYVYQIRNLEDEQVTDPTSESTHESNKPD